MSGPLETVGLLAGEGLLPLEIAHGVRRAGRRLVCVHAVEVHPGVREAADACYRVGFGDLGAALAAFRRHGVAEVVLAGKVEKLSALGTARMDAPSRLVTGRSPDFRDASLMDALVAVLEEAGFRVASQLQYARHLVPEPGLLGQRTPSAEEDEDIRLGLQVAAGIAALDVGQAVAVRRRVIVAVEAVEGTDAMIRRAGALARGIVVVKVSRPRQDPRYDLPVVGPQTVEALAQSGGTALAVEAERTILLERERMVALAELAGIALVAAAPRAS